MKKKICPICERELTSAHYCKLCKKLVLKPIVRNVDYSLNEIRKGDGVLLNQKPIREEERLKTEPEKEKKKAGDTSESSRQENFRSVDSTFGRLRSGEFMSGSSQSTSKKKLGCLSVFIVIILCIAAVNFFTYLSGNLLFQKQKELFLGDNVFIEYEGENDSEGLSIEEESEFIELDAEEVKSSGIRCDGETHFSCSFDSADRRLYEVFDQLGLQVESFDDSENYNIDSGEYVYSFYESYRYYSISGDNGEELSVLLNYDTATGEMHSLSVRAFYPEKNDIAAEILRQMADFVSGGEGTVTKEEILSALAEDDYLDKSEYNYYIYGYDYEGITAGLDSYYDWDEEELSTY